MGNEFIFVPVQNALSLKGQNFDIVINTGSLQEMPNSAVHYWMDFIQEKINTNIFYSFNYFLTNKKAFLETSLGDSNEIAPVLDPWWKVRRFEINPSILTVDACQRNWLEVCLERTERSDSSSEKAESLVLQASEFPIASNYWFALMWMAIWCNPKNSYVQKFIEGIKIFRDEVRAGVPQNFFINQRLTLKDKLKNIIKRFFFKKRALALERNSFSELDFYRRFL